MPDRSPCLSYVQIGWVTMDNASNNDTFMSKLEEELKLRNIPFDKVSRRIRSVKRQDFKLVVEANYSIGVSPTLLIWPARQF